MRVGVPTATWAKEEHAVSIKVNAGLDPAIECILFLDKTYAQTDEYLSPSIVTSQSLAEKHGIPVALVEEKAAPVAALEADLLAALADRKDLWGEMFYPGSSQENRLPWVLFFLDQYGGISAVDLELRRNLIAMTLNCTYDQVAGITDMASLFQIIDHFSCSGQTKWLCARVWQQPEEYYRRYRELIELVTPIVQRHSKAMEPLCQQATSFVTQTLEHDPTFFQKNFGFPSTPLESLHVFPMAINFNGIGVFWEESISRDHSYLMMGILREPLKELVSLYCDNSPYLTDRLKSIADLRRVEILKLLKNAPMYGQELADELSLSPATVSHHMNFLVSSGFVSVTRKGVKTSYSLHKQNLDSFLQNLRISFL